ncbi:UNVERIFIED_CONTAM: hypothetical protein K2H54_054687 [Gekko kuhli]
MDSEREDMTGLVHRLCVNLFLLCHFPQCKCPSSNPIQSPSCPILAAVHKTNLREKWAIQPWIRYPVTHIVGPQNLNNRGLDSMTGRSSPGIPKKLLLMARDP